jgi:hypothetical protein
MRSLALAAALLFCACGSHSSHGADAPGGGGSDGNGSNIGDAGGGDGGGSGSGETHVFGTGSLIIPMDLSYQATGMFQAYGLIYQLLKANIHVYWLIDPNKTYHAAACNDATNPCSWDCGVEGSGVKCTYPTSSPDFTATATIVWDDTNAANQGMTITHGYRGGPFAIDAADHDAALAIINMWNTQGMIQRTVFHVVSVHETTAPFTGPVGRTMLHAPTIAVFADGNEDIATGYIRAAGIPQSSGAEFPSNKCGTSNCGPGTANPDMLTEEAIMGPLGTCAAPNLDHHNGALFKADGSPAYCQIMSMHWNVTDREKVQCNGTTCPTTQAACGNNPITYNGHEVVAEVRTFLGYGTHFFAECQAVNAYENTVPNPAWPFLDDAGRDGHFLTTTGTLPACSTASPCTDTDYQCTNGTCQPKTTTWEDIPGYEVSTQPQSSDVKVLRPEIPYNQFDGQFGTTNGSEPSYNLSTYLGTTYKNNRQVTLLTGANGPGDQDLWMTGYLDGCGDVILKGQSPDPQSCGGKVSYLGGHQYSTTVPVTSGSQSQGTRLFLNALFEADCVTM